MQNGIDEVNVNQLLPLPEQSETSGHICRVRMGKLKTALRSSYFSQRVVNLWNSLPQGAVDPESINGFKKETDKYLIKSRIKG